MKENPSGRIGLEDAIDDDAVEVQVGIEQGAEAVDEDHCPDAELRARARAALRQAILHCIEEDVQGGVLDGRVAVKEIAQPVCSTTSSIVFPLPPLSHRE